MSHSLPAHLFSCLECFLLFPSHSAAHEHHRTLHQRLDSGDPIPVMLYAGRAVATICALSEMAWRSVEAEAGGLFTSLAIPQHLPRPSPILLRVTLHQPTDYLAVTGIMEFPSFAYTFDAQLPVAVKAAHDTILEIVKTGFEAAWGAPAPQMKWKEWTELRFVLVVAGRSWRIREDMEDELPEREGEWAGVEVGVASSRLSE